MQPAAGLAPIQKISLSIPCASSVEMCIRDRSYTNRVLFIRDGRIFTELRRGDSPRREFFDRIMEVVAMMGGEGSDAL